MNIIEKNEGTKVSYAIESNNLISFRDELFLNLAKCERDYPVHIDICEDENKMLTNRISSAYIAQIDIPERQYEYIDKGVDEQGQTITEKKELPFNMDNITLTLWAVEGA